MSERDERITNEHGRMHLRIDEEAGTCWMLVENVNRTDEHWLTLTSWDESLKVPIGYLRLRPITGPHTFEIAEVLPASGSLIRSQDGLLDPEGLVPGGSA